MIPGETSAAASLSVETVHVVVVTALAGVLPLARRVAFTLSLTGTQSVEALAAAVVDRLVAVLSDANAVGRLGEIGGAALNALGVVAHPVRRGALAVLADRRVANRREIAESIADEALGGDAGDDDVRPVEEALHHHLPMLDREQLVEYDPRSGDAVLWTDPGAVGSVLRS
jgi:hypothetical protein